MIINDDLDSSFIIALNALKSHLPVDNLRVKKFISNIFAFFAVPSEGREWIRPSLCPGLISGQPCPLRPHNPLKNLR